MADAAGLRPAFVLLLRRALQLPARRRGARLRHRPGHQGPHHLVRSSPLAGLAGPSAVARSELLVTGSAARQVQGEPVGREAVGGVGRDAVVTLGHRHRAHRRRRPEGGVCQFAFRHRRDLRLRGAFCPSLSSTCCKLQMPVV
jgi:hypothetical protein